MDGLEKRLESNVEENAAAGRWTRLFSKHKKKISRTGYLPLSFSAVEFLQAVEKPEKKNAGEGELLLTLLWIGDSDVDFEDVVSIRVGDLVVSPSSYSVEERFDATGVELEFLIPQMRRLLENDALGRKVEILVKDRGSWVVLLDGIGRNASLQELRKESMVGDEVFSFECGLGRCEMDIR